MESHSAALVCHRDSLRTGVGPALEWAKVSGVWTHALGRCKGSVLLFVRFTHLIIHFGVLPQQLVPDHI